MSSGDARAGRALIRDEAAERIKQYILDNRLRTGDPLPTEGELGARLGASRSSIREAIKILGALDIVEVRHGRGTYVGRLSLAPLVEGLAFRGRTDVQVLLELAEVRELFESGLADRLLDALDDARLDELDALVAEMADNAGSGSGFVAADRAFHGKLVEPLGNDLITQLSLAFWDVYAEVRPRLAAVSAEDERETVAAHRAMVDAVRSRDVTGFVAAVATHYAPVRRRVTALTTCAE